MAYVESYVAPRLSLRRCSSARALFALYIEVLAGTKLVRHVRLRDK